MYAEVRVTLRSSVEHENLSKDAETVRSLNMDMSTGDEQFKNALHTLVSQNMADLVDGAFEAHPASVDKVTEELRAQKTNKKTKKDENAASKKEG